MLSVEFEPAIPVTKQSQTYSLHKYLQEHLNYKLLTCHLLCLERIFERNIVILVITSCARPRVAVAECHPVPSHPIPSHHVPSRSVPSRPRRIPSHRIASCHMAPHPVLSHPIPYIKTHAYSNATVCQNLKPIGEEVSEIV
jgi:hypothetical protein